MKINIPLPIEPLAIGTWAYCTTPSFQQNPVAGLATSLGVGLTVTALAKLSGLVGYSNGRLLGGIVAGSQSRVAKYLANTAMIASAAGAIYASSNAVRDKAVESFFDNKDKLKNITAYQAPMYDTSNTYVLGS